ncbi:MAG: hypothetical protein WD002_03025 [Pseudomonadales bacterium]
MKIPEFSARQWLALIVLWVLLALTVGVFSQWPPITMLEPGATELKLTIRYSGKRLGECRQMEAPELERLPPNMRQNLVCPREKSPLLAELRVNGELRYQDTIAPSGLHNDGVLAAYEQLAVPVGKVHVSLRIKDDERLEEFTHEYEDDLLLTADRSVRLHFADSGFTVTGI